MRLIRLLWCVVRGHLRSRKRVVERDKLKFSNCKRCGTDLVQTRDRQWITLNAFKQLQRHAATKDRSARRTR